MPRCTRACSVSESASLLRSSLGAQLAYKYGLQIVFRGLTCKRAIMKKFGSRFFLTFNLFTHTFSYRLPSPRSHRTRRLHTASAVLCLPTILPLRKSLPALFHNTTNCENARFGTSVYRACHLKSGDWYYWHSWYDNWFLHCLLLLPIWMAASMSDNCVQAFMDPYRKYALFRDDLSEFDDARYVKSCSIQ